MSRSYGKIPRSGNKAPVALQPSEILIAIHGRHTLEQLAHELAIAVERLREAGAYGVEQFRIRLEPRDKQGKPVVLRNRAGEPIQKLQIPEPEAEPPYRPGPYDPLPARPSPADLASKRERKPGHSL